MSTCDKDVNDVYALCLAYTSAINARKKPDKLQRKMKILCALKRVLICTVITSNKFTKKTPKFLKVPLLTIENKNNFFSIFIA